MAAPDEPRPAGKQRKRRAPAGRAKAASALADALKAHPVKEAAIAAPPLPKAPLADKRSLQEVLSAQKFENILRKFTEYRSEIASHS